MAMKRYTPEELQQVLADHLKWLNDEEGGAGANLAGANLAGAYLDGANLDGANLAGANLAGAYLAGAKNFSPFLCIGPIGSRRGYTTVYLTTDRVRCGCFSGTLAEFEAKVQKTHGSNAHHLAEYTALIAMAKAVREAHPPREEAPAATPLYRRGQEVRLTDQALECWPWAPKVVGRVIASADGWTRIDFPDRYLSAPDSFLSVVEAEKGGAA